MGWVIRSTNTSQLSSLDDPTSRRELLVVASFLASYGTATRKGYATDLRLFAGWCLDYGLSLFGLCGDTEWSWVSGRHVASVTSASHRWDLRPCQTLTSPTNIVRKAPTTIRRP